MAEAISTISEGLDELARRDIELGIASAVCGMGRLTLSTGSPELAARLLGAAEALLDRLRAGPYSRQLHPSQYGPRRFQFHRDSTHVRELRAALGPKQISRFHHAVENGRTLNTHQVVDVALQLAQQLDVHRSTARFLKFGILAAVASLGPHAAAAQPSASGLLSVEQIRSEYVGRGYQVDMPITWWTDDGVTTFHVTDSSTDRVLMVLVYPDLATAASHRATVQAQEVTGGTHLYLAWRQNVALVESTTEDLDRQYAAEQKQANRAMLGMIDIAANDTTQPMQCR